MARKTDAGHWLVFRGEPQWLAWKEWLAREQIQKNFCPDALPVPCEWPPETAAAAASVGDYYRDLREEITRDEKREKRHSSHSWLPIPIMPRLWVRWSAQEQGNRVQTFRAKSAEPPQGGRTIEQLDVLLRGVGAVPWWRENYSPGPEKPKERERTEAEKTELAQREAALKDERLRLLQSKQPEPHEDRPV